MTETPQRNLPPRVEEKIKRFTAGAVSHKRHCVIVGWLYRIFSLLLVVNGYFFFVEKTPWAWKTSIPLLTYGIVLFAYGRTIIQWQRRWLQKKAAEIPQLLDRDDHPEVYDLAEAINKNWK